MRKAWKASVMLTVLIVLFFLEHLIPTPLCDVLLIATLTYGVSLILPEELSVHRRWGIAYLALTAATYLCAGILGFFPSWRLIESSVWDFLISPLPLFAIVDQCTTHFPCSISRAPYEIVPDPSSRLLYTLIVVAGVLAIIAAFAMTRKSKLAYRFWLIAIGFAIVEVASYFIADYYKWGSIALQRAAGISEETILAVCWAASYLIAFLLVTIGVDFKSEAGGPERTS
jgi:hypothetical protein